MMRRSAGFDADKARRQLLKEWYDVPALELTANDYITCRVNSVDLKNRLRDISRPIVVTACMFGSSESWGSQQHPLQWYFRAGGGAVHSIKSGHMQCSEKPTHSITSPPRVSSHRDGNEAKAVMDAPSGAESHVRWLVCSSARPILNGKCLGLRNV